MDNQAIVISEILSILNKVKDDKISDLDANLFGKKYDFTAGEMLDVCMELRRKYGINLNLFYRNISEFTVNNIAEALQKVC